ncbi:MAG: DEAD/DEAH box helicase [Gammaproteobacteria bacterium]|nr:DEAD/DEAH box helicase [Gammaproteobacteria bacterium]
MNDGFQRLHSAVQYHVANTLGWPGLRPLQELASGPLTEGRSALLIAPTAGGKTEAALLPILSRMLSEDWRGLSVLYISPLRALANNLEPRLNQLAGMLGRRVALWHGDIGQGQRRAVTREQTDLLLVTPEAVEGILCGSRTDHRALFENLRVVVVDELHAFAGDDRGWQLLALLDRLQHLTTGALQRVGLSATVGNPEALLQWFTAGNDPGVVIQPPTETSSPPEIKVDYVENLENAAQVIASLHSGEKRLVFCDSRARVEELAYLLRERQIEAHASHSSLSAEARQLAERAFAESSNCVIVATSTLELGIDVGDLDRVIQVDAPSTVAAFLQRLGRTGRRAGTSRNCLFLATDADALIRTLALLHLWRQGWVEPLHPPPLPIHVLAQQIFALVHQESNLREADLSEWLRGFLDASRLRGSRAEELLAWLQEEGWLRHLDGRLWLGDKAEARFRGKRFTDLLSVFSAPELFTVLHGRREIGQVHGSSLAGKDEAPPVLTLGARSWRVTRSDHNRRVVFVESTDATGKSRWLGSSRHLRNEHCTAAREVLAGEIPSHLLSRRATTLFAELRDDFAWLEPDGDVPLEVLPNGRLRLWTFMGGLANALLRQAIATLTDCTAGQPQQFYVDLACPGNPEEVRSRLWAMADPARPDIGEDERLPPLKFSETLPAATLSEVQGARYTDSSALERLRHAGIRLVMNTL